MLRFVARAVAIALVVAAPAAARSVAPKLVDKGAIPALKEIPGKLPDSPREAHRFHFQSPGGPFTVFFDAGFACDVAVRGTKAAANATGMTARLAVDDRGDVAITVAPARGERGGSFTLKIEGAWSCGGVGGLTCPAGTRCEIEENHPDALGGCVASGS